MILSKKTKICVVGLGYVGLPLAVAFSKKFSVYGYDLSKKKISDLKKGIDNVSKFSQQNIKRIHFSNNPNVIGKSKFIIVCIPTPVKKKNIPDLSLLKNATINIAKNINKKTIIIYESTVYPGITENFCIKILEKYSNLTYKKDFNVGYSPERINPGDKINNLRNIDKIVSADCDSVIKHIYYLYKSIIKRVHKVENIKTAEAAKIIENTQRDINIGLINEFSLILSKLNINIYNVLKAAETKWNFMKFEPGLVGDHCIGVDPYYLADLAKRVNVKSDVILSARKINENMVNYIFRKIVKKIKKNSEILILGLTFKENCNDIRNSKNISLAKKMLNKGYKVTINDPYLKKKNLKNSVLEKNFLEYNKCLKSKYDMVLLLVKHDFYKLANLNQMQNMIKKNGFFYDFKNMFPKLNIIKNSNFKYCNF